MNRSETSIINLYSCRNCDPTEQCIIGVDRITRNDEDTSVTNQGYFMLTRRETKYLFEILGRDDEAEAVFGDVSALQQQVRAFAGGDEPAGLRIETEQDAYMRELMQRQA